MEPPVLDSFLKYFSISTMSKNLVDDAGLQDPKTRKANLTEEQMQFLISKFGLDTINQKNLLSFTQSSTLKGLQDKQKDSKRQKLIKIKSLAMSLVNTPKERWNQLDRQLMSIVQDSLVFSLLKRL